MCVSVQLHREDGSGFGSWKTVPAVPGLVSVPAKRFRRFRFPVPVPFLGHPVYVFSLYRLCLGKDPHPQDKIQHLDFTKDPRPLYYKTPPCAFYHKNVCSKAVFGP